MPVRRLLPMAIALNDVLLFAKPKRLLLESVAAPFAGSAREFRRAWFTTSFVSPIALGQPLGRIRMAKLAAKQIDA